MPGGPSGCKMHAMKGARRWDRAMLLLVSTAALLLPPVFPVTPSAAAAPASAPLIATGHATGSLSKGHTVVVTITAREQQGWQSLTEVAVELRIRGATLDRVTLDPARVTISMPGFGQPQASGLGGTLRGRFFDVDASNVGLSARGTDFRAVLPLTLIATPPPQARLYFSVSDASLNMVGPKPLGAPAASGGGFSWQTLLLVMVVALFAGGFVGNLYASRRRPPQRLSVYSAVQRRLADERSGQQERAPGGGSR